MAKEGSPGVGAMNSILEHSSNSDDMDTNQPAPIDESCSKVEESTHAQTMKKMGYETPMPLIKRLKTDWELLVDACPCPPHFQHQMWAHRIRRLYEMDCGLPYYRCECICNKCEKTRQDEVTIYHSISNDNADGHGSFVDGNQGAHSFEPMNPLEFRNTSSGVEAGHLDNYRIKGPPTMAPTPLPVYGYVHLFKEQSLLNAVDGPHTPFMTFLSGMAIDAFPNEREPPRVMWVRAKAVEPTYLSFR